MARNKFSGTCYRCGKIVDPGAGHYEKVTYATRKKYGGWIGSWLVQHASCAKLYRNTNTHHLYNPPKINESQPEEENNVAVK
jgi:hypothetical protein